MKICAPHWTLMREAITARGLFGLVAKSGEAALESMVSELRGETAADDPKSFDPLMSMNWHWNNSALRNGGLYLMSVDVEANPTNEGHYCPVCEFEKHVADFDAAAEIGIVADQMQAYAREHQLIPAVQ